MKAIVTAVHSDGAQWGWPGEPVFRYQGEDGSWAWVPQDKHQHAVGDIIDIPDGWEWLDDRERAKKLAAIKRVPIDQRVTTLRHAVATTVIRRKKNPAQLQREIDEVLKGRR